MERGKAIGKQKLDAVEGLVSEVAADTHVDGPGESVQRRRRRLVGGLEIGIHLLPHHDQGIGDGNSHESDREAQSCKDGAFVHKSPHLTEHAVSLRLAHGGGHAAKM